MKTEQEAMNFINYVRKQAKYLQKPEDFNLVDWLNEVLQKNEGYEDYLLVKNEETNFVGLYKYSDFLNRFNNE